MSFSTNALYRIPTVDDFDGKASFAFINPRLVSVMAPHEIEVGEEAPFTKTVNGTRVVTSEESFFVPLPLTEVADKLGIDLVGKEQEANA